MGLKILGTVGTHIFFNFYLEKNIILCILKGILPFKMHIKFPFKRIVRSVFLMNYCPIIPRKSSKVQYSSFDKFQPQTGQKWDEYMKNHKIERWVK